MDVRVEAGPIVSRVTACFAAPVVSTQLNIGLIQPMLTTQWVCFSSARISINGHSLSAINPDFVKVGDLATSLA